MDELSAINICTNQCKVFRCILQKINWAACQYLRTDKSTVRTRLHTDNFKLAR